MLQCDAGAGYLTLQFRENTTRPIPWDSTASQLEEFLEELYTYVSFPTMLSSLLLPLLELEMLR